MKKQYLKLLLITIIGIALFAACSSDSNDKKTESKTNTTTNTENSSGDSENSSDIKNPCEILEFEEIQAVMEQTMNSENGEDGKYFDSGSTQKCSWEADDTPFSSFEIRVGIDGEGSNSLDVVRTAFKDGLVEIPNLGDDALANTKLSVIHFTYNGIFYEIQSVANEKDFSGDTSIPEELNIEGSGLGGGLIKSNLAAEYIIAQKIIEAL